MKKLLGRIFSAGAAVALFLTLSAGQVSAAEKNTDRFVDGTIINGLGVTGMTTEEAKNFIESFYQGGYSLRIVSREGTQEIIHDTDIGYRVTVTGDLEKILEEENASGRLSGPDVDNRYTVELSAEYDREKLKEELQNLSFVKSARETRDAGITPWREGQPFEIVPEVQGNELDLEKLTAAVENALNSQQEKLELADSDCYKTVQITSDNEELVNLCNAMNQRADMTIAYRFGEKEEILEGSEIVSWLRTGEDLTVQVDETLAAAYVKKLADTYDTYEKPHTFRTTSGEDVTVTGPYGWRISQAAETAELINAVVKGESCTREPVYDKTAASRGEHDYGDTYVEVDLKNQHLYLYEKGTCIMDSPFVSGNVSKNWTTPDGIYFLYYKQLDKVLRGEDYETPVRYWMPFNGGIGFHDASWRSSFGGEIYKTNGSHGCINLPPAAAGTLYEHVYKNMPVICHGQNG